MGWSGKALARSATLWLCTTLCCASALACAARRPGPDEPIAGEAWVREVHIKGAKSLDADDIKDGLASRPPRGYLVVHKTRLDSSLIERDRARIRTYYRSRGFFDAEVTTVDIKKISENKSDVIFHVREGKRATVEEISIQGLPEEIRQDPEFDLGVEEGENFDHGEFIDGQGRIRSATQEKGYAHAEVHGRAEVEHSDRHVALRYEVVAGPKVRFGEIYIRGLKTIPESAVRNRLKLKTGDFFHPRKIAESQASIRSLGRFGVVRIDFDNDSKSPISDLAITVTEAPQNEIRAGGGVGIDQNNFQFRGRAEYTRHGIIDPLVSFTVQGQPAYAIVRTDVSQRAFVGELSTSLTRADLLQPLGQGKGTLTYDVDVLEAYSSQGGDLAFSVSQPLAERKLRVGLGWRFELLDFIRIEDAIDDDLRDDLGFATPYRSAYFEQSLALDLRDSPLNARNGYYAAISMEEGGSFAGGAFNYGRINSEVRYYRALGERLTFASRGSAGSALWGTLPITRRFFSGGATNHRGFSQRYLSPTASANRESEVSIGGDTSVGAIFEARVNAIKLGGEWLGLTVFADGGDVVLASDSIAWDNLHWAAGLGIRYQTLVGPIRFDVGYRLNRAGEGEIRAGDRLAFHLFIGEAF